MVGPWRILGFELSVLLLVLADLSSPLVAEMTLFVSPSGNDRWSGEMAEPTSDHSDGPLATVTAARDAIREARRRKLMGPITVQVREGIYRIDQPLVFGADDSGSEDALVRYVAYPGEKPVISGGRRIEGWEPKGNSLWATTLPNVASGAWYFRQMYVNGHRAIPARTPNIDAFQSGGPIRPLTDRDAARRDPNCKLGFRYLSCQSGMDFSDPDSIVVYFHAWTASRHLVRDFDTEKREVHFRNPSVWPIGWWGKNERFYIEASRSALDTPGEFHLDRRTGLLTYFPREGEDMRSAAVVAPVTECLLQLDADADHTVHDLSFEGLSFQHSSWTMPKTDIVDGQAAAFTDTAAIFARGATRCRFFNCEVGHTGGYALWLEDGCQYNQVERCHLHDLGAGGVRLGQTNPPDGSSARAEHNTVENCFIHDGGHVFHAGVGVWLGRTSFNRVMHNEICDFLYSGVSVGWSWGYAESTAHHNLIESNHIHHLGWRQLSDMGGIYCLGDSPGTELRNNVIHDVMSHPAGYGGWGLYTDEGSTGILMENNVVYRTKDGGFHQHYGRDNIVRNNVFAFSCGRGQIVRTRSEPHRSFTFERNIVFYREPPLLGGNWDNNEGFQLRNNVYWNVDRNPPIFPGELNLAEWQAKGNDIGSVVADPEFFCPQQFDFRIPENSPARAVGFIPIDTRSAGLVGDSSWTSLPERVSRRPFVMPWEESK